MDDEALEALRYTFSRMLFDLTDPTENVYRFYYLAWQPTLFDRGAVVRIYGRKGGQQRALSPVPFESLEEAWPMIRGIVRKRLRHGYRVAG